MTEKCPRCWIGDLHPIEATYTRLLHPAQLFAMPQAPAWRCDICGFQAWDENFMMMIEASFTEDDNDTENPSANPPIFFDD